MRIIGITGPIAAGKSTVDAMLRDLGADPVVDADRVVHDLYATSTELQDSLVAAFGPEVRAEAGGIDRRVLGTKVFGDPAALRQLEQLVHPITRRTVRGIIETTPPDGTAVVDAVKLLTGDLAALCTVRWWVVATPDAQRTRMVETRGLSHAEADARLAAQLRLDDVRDMIDLVIDNSGSLDDTRRQIEAAWHALHSR